MREVCVKEAMEGIPLSQHHLRHAHACRLPGDWAVVRGRSVAGVGAGNGLDGSVSRAFYSDHPSDTTRLGLP